MNKIMDEFKNSEIAKRLGSILSSYRGSKVTIMEVCGTHTMAISKYGIRELIPENIKLVSGPGCPVCVTPNDFINGAIELSRKEDTIITTFGDLMRIPGKDSSLLREKALGRDIRVVYSPLDCLKVAADNPGKKVIFLSVGFETTTPVIALTLTKVLEEGIGNFLVLSANKTVPEALKVLVEEKDIGISGYLYPGHVSAIIGMEFYQELADKYCIPGVVTGFEPLDILHGIIKLVENINKKRYIVENGYSRVVSREGNPIAVEKMYEVFEPCDALWRGIGNIPGSGLKLKDKYAHMDAWKVFEIKPTEEGEPKGCLCGEVLKGKKNPKDCPLFGKVCTPESPVGACMVSSEGTCAAYYKYSV